MTQLDDILTQIPLDQIAASLGVDRATAEAATRTALPALLGGLEANAADPAGAASLAGAIGQHDATALGAGLDQIDTEDGQKIVHNIFGDNTDGVISALGSTNAGRSPDLMSQLLPMLAPIVMAFLASRMAGGGLGSILGGGSGAAPSGRSQDAGSAGGGLFPGAAGGGSGGGGLADILGGMLGGGAGGSGSAGGGAGLDDLLGGVLGGMLGGGKR